MKQPYPQSSFYTDNVTVLLTEFGLGRPTVREKQLFAMALCMLCQRRSRDLVKP